MRRGLVVGLALAFGLWLSFGRGAEAACTVPNTLTNGQTADASQVMANFNSVLGCVNTAPAGSTNALQYNAGSGAFGGLGPLTNGQIAIGSTGNAPQAAQLTAGSGITITNGPGNITISGAATPYTPPKLANFTWGNQPSGTTAADTNTGLAIYQPDAGFNIGVLWDNTAIPGSTNFTVTTGFNLSGLSSGYLVGGIAIGDGTGKFVTFLLVNEITVGAFELEGPGDWNSYTSRASYGSSYPILPTMNLLRVNYDRTNFNISIGSDINSLVQVASFPANAFLGTPTQVGLIIWSLNQNSGATYFHYGRSDGAP